MLQATHIKKQKFNHLKIVVIEIKLIIFTDIFITIDKLLFRTFIEFLRILKSHKLTLIQNVELYDSPT